MFKSPFFWFSVLLIIAYIIYSFKDNIRTWLAGNNTNNGNPNNSNGNGGNNWGNNNGNGQANNPYGLPNTQSTNFGSCDFSKLDNNKNIPLDGTVNNSCEVFVLQTKLNNICGSGLVADGDWGPRTGNAFRCFLSTKGFPIKATYTFSELMGYLLDTSKFTSCNNCK